jgi:hypothetical protein
MFLYTKSQKIALLPFLGDQSPLTERKTTVSQWVRKLLKTRPCLAIFATVGTCAVVLLVTLLILLPRHDEATGTSVRLPEDGNISPRFTFQGNYEAFTLALIAYHTLHMPSQCCLFRKIITINTSDVN